MQAGCCRHVRLTIHNECALKTVCVCARARVCNLHTVYCGLRAHCFWYMYRVRPCDPCSRRAERAASLELLARPTWIVTHVSEWRKRGNAATMQCAQVEQQHVSHSAISAVEIRCCPTCRCISRWGRSTVPPSCVVGAQPHVTSCTAAAGKSPRTFAHRARPLVDC